MNDQTERIIVIERVFNASKKDVWRALTEPELMKKWYFDIPGFQATIGYKFEFTGGPDDGVQYTHLCEITEVIYENKLRFSWKYEGNEGISFVTFLLNKVDENNTRLTLSHEGIESFPASNPDFAIGNFETGWNHIMNTALQNFLLSQ